MSTEQMPAAEAASYELAFHVLPTVAEGEVADVASALRSAIEAAGGTVTSEEAPERFDLAYDIVKYLEGRNRKFSSAYFGWMRFTLEPVKLAEVSEAVEGTSQLLRHLLIRLNKAEEEHVFMFHEALADQGVSETVELNEEAATGAPAEEKKEETEDKKDETTEEAADNGSKEETEVK